MQSNGYTRAAAVVQHDTDALTIPFTPKALYCGGSAAADVKVKTVCGSIVTFTDVPAGTVLPVAVNQIFATGTDFADADMLVLGD